jgi:hypothetical protein
VLAGWYLMFPPEQPGSLMIEDQAPISQWQGFRSFDSAQECMKARASAIRLSKVSEETMHTDVPRRNVHIKALVLRWCDVRPRVVVATSLRCL